MSAITTLFSARLLQQSNDVVSMGEGAGAGDATMELSILCGNQDLITSNIYREV